MASSDHSNLEVVPQSDHPDAQKYSYSPYSSDLITVYSNDMSETHRETLQGAKYDQTQAQATVCGIRRRTFWIVIIVAVVVVVGAIGGGVGGALASRQSKSNGNITTTERERPSSFQTASANTVDSSSAPLTPTAATTSITTTSLVGPTATILRDCPSSNNSVYSVITGNMVMQFRKTCERSYLNANGDDFAYARVTPDLNECINQCAAYNINNRDQIQQGRNRICNSVCWRNSFGAKNNEVGGQCYRYTTQNVTSNWESVWRYRMPVETGCDGAALINQEF